MGGSHSSESEMWAPAVLAGVDLDVVFVSASSTACAPASGVPELSLSQLASESAPLRRDLVLSYGVIFLCGPLVIAYWEDNSRAIFSKVT